MHPYYTVALAPAISALTAIGGRELWRGRAHFAARVALTLMVASTGIWSFVLLARNADWHPELRWSLLALTAVTAFGLLVGLDRFKRWATVLLAATVLTGVAGTAAYAVATASVAHSGSIPISGPASAGGGMGGGPGDGMGGESTDSELTALLEATTTRWAAATTSAQSAASLELASGTAVMGIGGFTGGDPAPTLAEFQQYVEDGAVRYFVSGGMGGGGGPGGGSSEITSWVEANFTATTVGGTTVYDLTHPTS